MAQPPGLSSGLQNVKWDAYKPPFEWNLNSHNFVMLSAGALAFAVTTAISAYLLIISPPI